MQPIVAMSGGLPQSEREAKKLGYVAVVQLAPPKNLQGYPGSMLQGGWGQRLQKIGGMNQGEWNTYFDKASLVGLDEPVDHIAAGNGADALLPHITKRGRLVLLGQSVARAFGVWETDCYYRWRWADWDRLRGGDTALPIEQLFAVVPAPDAPQKYWNTSKHLSRQRTFWEGLIRTCRAGLCRPEEMKQAAPSVRQGHQEYLGTLPDISKGS